MSEVKEEVKEIVKKKRGNPDYETSLQNYDNFESNDDRKAYNARSIMQMMDLFNRPKVRDEEDAIQRTQDYFLRCANLGIRPTWEEYAMAMGVSRQSLWYWVNGIKNPPFDADIVRRAKDFMAAYDARMVTDGKLNPVTYIFRSKNYYDMKDTQDVVVSPNQFETRSREQIIKEAEMLPEE